MSFKTCQQRAFISYYTIQPSYYVYTFSSQTYQILVGDTTDFLLSDDILICIF